MAHEHVVYMMLADSAAQMGNIGAIDKYISMLEPLIERDNHQPYRAIYHRSKGIALRLKGQYTEAEGHLKKAAGLFDVMATSWQLGRTYTELAALEIDRSDPGEAQAYFLKALAEFERIQALPDLKQTRRALDAIEALE